MLYKQTNTIGCLLLHGFTGNPAEMEGLASFLRRQGCFVNVPTLPGHATQPDDLRDIPYQEWIDTSEKALRELKQQHPVVFVVGQSMGGTLALHLAANHQFNGVVTLAAALRLPLHLELASYVFAPFVPIRYKPNGSDVRDLNGKALLQNYDHYPMSAVRQLMRMLRKVRNELAAVTMPLLAIHAREDHVVPFDNLALLMSLVKSAAAEPMIVEKSYHVLTVDHDRDIIFSRIGKFILQHTSNL